MNLGWRQLLTQPTGRTACAVAADPLAYGSVPGAARMR
jgi:hypothetical protein